MKKSAFVILYFLFNIPLFCQLDNGAQIPMNISGTDIMTNEEVNVQDWLDDNKTVVLNFFTSWCSQCWEFKESNWLNQLNVQYGPLGTDQIRILSIEAEPMNSPDHLQMEITGVIPNRSQGDWTQEVSYNIIDDASFNEEFAIELAPVIYIIRPNGEMIELNRNNAIYDIDFQLKSMFPKSKDVILQSDLKDASFCGEFEVPESKFTVLNMGSESIENFTLDYYVGQTIIQSIYIDEVIPALSSKLIESDKQKINSDSEINVFVSTINGESYAIDQYNLITADVVRPVLNTERLTMKITFDEFPHETQWTIRSDSGIQIARGNYSPDEIEPWGETVHRIPIPEDTECIHMTLEDSYGDGWLRWGKKADGSSTPIPGVQFYNQYGILIKDKHNLESTTNFSTDLDAIDIYAFRDVLSSQKEPSVDELRIYPSPAFDIIYLEGIKNQDLKEVNIINSNGQIVLKDINVSAKNSLQIAELISGFYNVQIVDINNHISYKSFIKM